MSAPSPSASSYSARAAVDGYSSENERSRSPLPIIHRVTNSPVVPTASSLPFFTYEPSILDIDNLLMAPAALQQAHSSLAGARENEGGFSPLVERDSLEFLVEKDSVDLLLEGDNEELSQSILGAVRELYTFGREAPVSNTALLSFNAADSGEGTSDAGSALKNMQQVGRLPLQLDYPLITGLLNQVTRKVPSRSGAILASELPSSLVCSAAPSSEFESASASAIMSVSRPNFRVSTKNVSLVFKEALNKNEIVYLIFDLSTGALPLPSLLRVRLLSLKTGNQQLFNETKTVYKRSHQLFVLIPEDQCFLSDNSVLEILCFSCISGRIRNPCYRMKSTFALTNITSVFWDPMPPSKHNNERGKIRSFLP